MGTQELLSDLSWATPGRVLRGSVAPVSLAAARRRSGFERARSSAYSPALTWLVLGGLTLAALLLRASQIHQSLLGDEVFTFQDIHGRSFKAVLTTVHSGGENSPPLYFALAWASAKLGDPTVWIRLPSILLSTATVPVIYAIGRRSVGSVAGMVAAAIYALTPFTVYYGIEARPYATMTFFVALSTLALLSAASSKSFWWWAIYVLSAAAAAYSHYTCIFVLAVQGVWALWVCRDRIRVPLAANLLAVLLYVPWLPELRGKALAVIGALYPLTVRRVLTDVLRPVPGHPGAPLSAIPTIPGLVAVAVCVLVGIGFLLRDSGTWLKQAPAHLRLLIALTLASPVGLLLYSLLVTDLWLPRGLSASIPALTLVLGAVLTAPPRRVALAAVTVVLAVMVAGTIRSFDTLYSRPPFRQMASYLDRVATPSDPIVIVSIVGQPAISVELHKPHRLLPGLGSVWSAVPANGTAYLVIDNHVDQALHLGTPRHRGFVVVARRQYFGGGFPTEILAYRRG